MSAIDNSNSFDRQIKLMMVGDFGKDFVFDFQNLNLN
jgi:hypothetical protein